MDAFGDLDDVADQSGFAADPYVALGHRGAFGDADAAGSVRAVDPSRPPRQPPRRRRWAFRLPHHLTVFLQTHAHSPQTG